MTELAGKRVLITGAASGIGRLLAHATADRGSQLILLDNNHEGLEIVRSELEKKGTSTSAHLCDLRNQEAIERTARQVTAHGGAVDVLVNNAGVVTGKPLLETSDSEMTLTIDVNTLAPMRLTKALLPAMVARDSGHIVNVSSAAGIVGSARLTDYCASKFALFGFDEALRTDLRRMGSKVRTTIVCPYYIDTGMFSGAKTRFSWLLPILAPEHVTRRIVRAIERDRSRLVMPWFVYSSWLVRLLPVSAFDALSDFFGISRSMDDFTGRTSQGAR